MEKENKNIQIQIQPITLGIIVSAIIAIISGAYLYTQGEKIWDLAKSNLQENDQIQIEPIFKTKPKRLEKTVVKEEIKNGRLDTITQSKSHPENSSTLERNELKILINTPYANLRSGPGLQFPISLTGKQNEVYSVINWKANWFQVKTKSSSKTAWIRNDLIKKMDDTNKP